MIAFVRHGQTAVNRAGLLQGRVDAPLTDLGVAQAEAVAAALGRDERAVSRVISSPLRRAADTAAPIAGAFGLSVEVDERLVELDYGEWDQRPLRDVAATDWERWRADPAFTPPGGESLLAVELRVAEFCEAHADDDLVVAVSHVSPIKAGVCWALGVDATLTWRMYLDLASVTRVGRRAGAPYLASFNETPAAAVPDGAIRR
jgi:broad specificity phosphatase PhoE